MQKLKTIGDLCDGRKNNFDIIRFFAATMVIFSHCYPLSRGASIEDPLATNSHFINFGGLGVYIFFIISGFLITKSYCSRQNYFDFLKARVLRIFPGLIAAVLFSTFIIGIIATKLSLIDYLHNRDTYNYIIHNISLYIIYYGLPGVFLNNPYPSAVNGSLWTLPVEFSMYLVVGLIGICGILKKKKISNLFVLIGAVLYFCLSYSGLNIIEPSYKQVLLYFIIGIIVYVNREYIPVSNFLFLITIILGIFLYKFNMTIFAYLFPFILTYMVFFIALNPSIKLYGFGKYGDFSYGLYIYAFPIQQLVAMKFKGISIITMFSISFMLTLLTAVLSWHFIEKPAMKLKNKKLLHSVTAINKNRITITRVLIGLTVIISFIFITTLLTSDARHTLFSAF